MHKDPRRLKSCNFTCNPGSNLFCPESVPDGMRIHAELEKEIKRYKKELADDLQQYSHKEYVPKLPGVFGIASGIYRIGGDYRREMRNLYYRMTLQANAWKQHYIAAIRATSQPRMILFLTKKLAEWQEKYDRSKELCICCMTSVTISFSAPVPSVTSIVRKKRAHSDVEDDL